MITTMERSRSRTWVIVRVGPGLMVSWQRDGDQLILPFAMLVPIAVNAADCLFTSNFMPTPFKIEHVYVPLTGAMMRVRVMLAPMRSPSGSDKDTKGYTSAYNPLLGP